MYKQHMLHQLTENQPSLSFVRYFALSLSSSLFLTLKLAKIWFVQKHSDAEATTFRKFQNV